jgi:hypothetical protein
MLHGIAERPLTTNVSLPWQRQTSIAQGRDQARRTIDQRHFSPRGKRHSSSVSVKAIVCRLTHVQRANGEEIKDAARFLSRPHFTETISFVRNAGHLPTTSARARALCLLSCTAGGSEARAKQQTTNARRSDHRPIRSLQRVDHPIIAMTPSPCCRLRLSTFIR